MNKISVDDAIILIDLGDRLLTYNNIQHDDVRIWIGKLGHYFQADRLMDLARDLEFLHWDSDTDQIVFGRGVRDALSDTNTLYENIMFDLGWRTDGDE